MAEASISKIERRVMTACPEWFTWPLELKWVYALASAAGFNRHTLNTICEHSGFDRKKIDELIEDTPTFKARWEELLETHQYPKLPQWTNAISPKMLQQLVMNDNAMFLVPKEFSEGKNKAFLNNIYEHAGIAKLMNNLSEHPAIKFNQGFMGKADGEEEAESGLGGNW